MFAQLNNLSVKYQSEAEALQYADFTVLVIKALFRYTVSTIRTKSTVTYEGGLKIPAGRIADAAVAVIGAGDFDWDPQKVTSRRVGKAMTGLRLQKAPRDTRGEARAWLVSIDDLQEMSATYSIPLPKELLSLG